MKTKTFVRRYVLTTFFVCLAVFIACCMIGYFAMSSNTKLAEELVGEFADMIKNNGIMDDQGNISAIGLFINNFRATGMAVLMGFIPFLFLPAFVIFVNGMLSGATFAFMGTTGKNVLLCIAAGILPHGIFEIPAVCLGITLGFLVCRFICSKILDKGRLNSIKAGEFFAGVAKVFFFVATPLLVIAAIVEANVTPLIMNAVL